MTTLLASAVATACTLPALPATAMNPMLGVALVAAIGFAVFGLGLLVIRLTFGR